MDSTGTRLREERETRGMSLDQIAEATGVGLPYLEAMEAGNFDALPGRAFGKLYIRAYAEVLAFDPQPLIDQYDRERRHGGPPDPTRPAPAGSRPVAEAIARWKAARSDVMTEMEEDEEQPVLEAAEAPEETAPEHVEIEVETSPEMPVEAQPIIEAEQPLEATALPHVEIRLSPPPTSAPAPMPAPSLAQPARPRRALIVGGLVLAAIVVAIVMAIGGGRAPQQAPAPASTPPADAAPSAPAPPPVAVKAEPPPPKAAPAPAPKAAPAKPTGPPSDLSITESGLGRRIVSGRLEGEGNEFHEGDVVCFQTRVLGGQRGDAIRHVWIYEGRAQQSISLRVNDADWRTHSAKTIYKSGSWSVEARDGSGRVLASAAFTCRPRGQ